MSVLVEALTVVIRRKRLDTAFPGGAEAFVQAARDLPTPPRFACDTDPLLINVSVESATSAADIVTLLDGAGLAQASRQRRGDFAVVDQHEGPTSPCRWLTWERFTDAVTVAWMAGRDPGTLATPTDWVPAGAASLPDTPLEGRFLSLGQEGGAEVVLDLQSGAQIRRSPKLEPPPEEVPKLTPLYDAVVVALNDAGWPPHILVPGMLNIDLQGVHALYSCRYVIDEGPHVVVCYTRAPMIIPKAARRKTTEFIIRANYGLMIGGFELSLDDGALFFRASCAVEDGHPTTRMITALASVGSWSFDRYFPRLLDVIYGNRPVLDAVHAAERG